MTDTVLRLVSFAEVLADTPQAWARELLADGEIAVLGGEGGLADVDRVAQHLDLVSVPVLRGGESPTAQDEIVIAFAGSLPLVWIAPAFSEHVVAWARDRGPMTLLVTADGALPQDEQRRVARFASSLGRQSE
jgi:hypothetical protein